MKLDTKVAFGYTYTLLLTYKHMLLIYKTMAELTW